MDIILNLDGEHVDDGIEGLLLLDIEVLVVVPHDHIKQVLIVGLHPLALEIVVFELALDLDLHPAIALKVKKTLFYFFLKRWAHVGDVWHRGLHRRLAHHRWLIHTERHIFANI